MEIKSKRNQRRNMNEENPRIWTISSRINKKSTEIEGIEQIRDTELKSRRNWRRNMNEENPEIWARNGRIEEDMKKG